MQPAVENIMIPSRKVSDPMERIAIPMKYNNNKKYN